MVEISLSGSGEGRGWETSSPTLLGDGKRGLLLALDVALHPWYGFSLPRQFRDQLRKYRGFAFVVGDAILGQVVGIVEQGQDKGLGNLREHRPFQR